MFYQTRQGSQKQYAVSVLANKGQPATKSWSQGHLAQIGLCSAFQCKICSGEQKLEEIERENQVR